MVLVRHGSSGQVMSLCISDVFRVLMYYSDWSTASKTPVTVWYISSRCYLQCICCIGIPYCRHLLFSVCVYRRGQQYRYLKVSMSVRLAISCLSYLVLRWSLTWSSWQPNRCRLGWETARRREKWVRIVRLDAGPKITEQRYWQSGQWVGVGTLWGGVVLPAHWEGV